jgi:hypothetical protein
MPKTDATIEIDVGGRRMGSAETASLQKTHRQKLVEKLHGKGRLVRESELF